MLRDLIRHFGDDFLLDVFVDVCIFAGRVHTIFDTIAWGPTQYIIYQFFSWLCLLWSRGTHHPLREYSGPAVLSTISEASSGEKG